jgi:hypothetical protein
MEEFQTNGETHGAPTVDNSAVVKSAEKKSPIIIGDKLPTNLQELLLKFYRQKKADEAQSNQKKANEKQILNKNSPNATLIKIRIPPRVPKKPKKKKIEEEEEDELESITFSTKTRFRTNHFNIRSTTPTNRIQIPKRVLTPDWDKTSDRLTEKIESRKAAFYDEEEENENEKMWKAFDQIERHRRLEIYENRIIWGLNNEYQHPAQSIKAASEGMSFVLSKDESQKAKRYEEMPCKHVVPKFWEPRVWDKPEDSLDETKSQELQDSIQAASAPKLTRPVTPQPSKKQLLKRSLSVSVGSTKRGRPKRGMDLNFLVLPIGNFETDSDNERSDWEDNL